MLFTCLQDDHDPTIFTPLDCLCWPKWKATDSLSTLERLETDILKFYDLKHKIWVEALLSYPHTMKTDGYLLLEGFFEAQGSVARISMAALSLLCKHRLLLKST